jgi:hypothetical protein
MSQLREKIQIKDWSELLVGAEGGSADKEIEAMYSEFDRNHVLAKAQHVYEALSIMNEAANALEALTWEQPCRFSSNRNCGTISWRTIANWYLEMHEHSTDDDYRFRARS